MKNLKFLSLWSYFEDWEDEEDPRIAEKKILELQKSFASVFGNRRQKSTRVILKEPFLTDDGCSDSYWDTHQNVSFDLFF